MVEPPKVAPLGCMVQPTDSKIMISGTKDGSPHYPRYQDLVSGSTKDADDTASCASTMASFYSDRSFPSDHSTVSSLCSDSYRGSVASLDNASDGAVAQELVLEVGCGLEQEQGGASTTSSGSIPGAALPPRRFHHRRTRSIDLSQSVHSDPATTSLLGPSDQSTSGSNPGFSFRSGYCDEDSAPSRSGTWSASLATVAAPIRHSKIRFASPIVVEVEPIEEEEEIAAEVPEEPAPMAPLGNP